MHKFVIAPVAVARTVPRHCREAVRTRRIGNLSADHGLDALNFFLADVQTGFGPFIAVYLTANHWSAAEIGTALGVGTVVTIVAQIPAGAAIDVIAAKRGATLVALLAVLASTVLLALLPSWYPVLGAEILHGIASCMLVPAVAAVTLTRVGRAGFALRLGRNTRFMALGNALGAGLMGLAGAKISAAAPFWLAALSTLPAIAALLALPPRHKTEPRAARKPARAATAEGWKVLRDHRLLVFTLCVMLFHAGNAFLLPLAMNRLTGQRGDASTNLVLAACLLIAQGVVALASPWVGRQADRWGRRRVLLIGFAAVPIHAVVLALAGGVPWIIGAELFDGMGGAMFGVLQPLVAADVTQGTNRFNLSLGVLGLAAGLGATLSATLGGRIAAAFGPGAAFWALAGTGLLAVLAVFFLMPETRVAPEEATQDRRDP